MVNKVTILGNLCSDPEFKNLLNGTSVASLRVATSRKWKDKDGNMQEETEFHRCTVFGKSAEFCGKYLRKGFKVYAEGRIKTRKYQVADGTDRYATEIILDTVQNLTPRESGGDNQGGDPSYGQHGFSSTGEELPF